MLRAARGLADGSGLALGVGRRTPGYRMWRRRRPRPRAPSSRTISAPSGPKVFLRSAGASGRESGGPRGRVPRKCFRQPPRILTGSLPEPDQPRAVGRCRRAYRTGDTEKAGAASGDFIGGRIRWETSGRANVPFLRTPASQPHRRIVVRRGYCSHASWSEGRAGSRSLCSFVHIRTSSFAWWAQSPSLASFG